MHVHNMSKMCTKFLFCTGAVSWGIGCGYANYPGVYANVYNLLDWVESNL